MIQYKKRIKPLGCNRPNGAVYGFHNAFNYNHFIYRGYLLCTWTASVYIIH